MSEVVHHLVQECLPTGRAVTEGNFGLEIPRHGLSGNMKFNSLLIAPGATLGIPAMLNLNFFRQGPVSSSLPAPFLRKREVGVVRSLPTVPFPDNRGFVSWK